MPQHHPQCCMAGVLTLQGLLRVRIVLVLISRLIIRTLGSAPHPGDLTSWGAVHACEFQCRLKLPVANRVSAEKSGRSSHTNPGTFPGAPRSAPARQGPSERGVVHILLDLPPGRAV